MCPHSEDEKDMERPKHTTAHRGTHGTVWMPVHSTCCWTSLPRPSCTSVSRSWSSLELLLIPWENLPKPTCSWAACGFAQHYSQMMWTHVDISHQTWTASSPSELVALHFLIKCGLFYLSNVPVRWKLGCLCSDFYSAQFGYFKFTLPHPFIALLHLCLFP